MTTIPAASHRAKFLETHNWTFFGKKDNFIQMPRENERVPYYTEIMLESAAGMRGARISDVSAGGCYVDTISPAIEGEEISFQFKNSTGAGLKFTGTVAYVLSNLGFGIKFTDLTDQHKAAIDEIMKAAGR